MAAIYLSLKQSNDFIRKYLQDNISVCSISKNSEDQVYFVKLKSGKLFRKRITSWQYRPFNNIGLCCGECTDFLNNRLYMIRDYDHDLLAKANEKVQAAITKWENLSPI